MKFVKPAITFLVLCGLKTLGIAFITVFAAFLMLLPLSGPARSENVLISRPEVSAMRFVLNAIKTEDWHAANQAAGDNEAIRDFVEWNRLRAGQGSAEEALEFTNKNRDWPGLELLLRRAESGLLSKEPAFALRFFQDRLPQTGQGTLALAHALIARGERDLAARTLIRAWIELNLGEGVENSFLDQFDALLMPYNTARVERLLWDGEGEAAERMLPMLGEEEKKLAELRLLRMGNDGRRGLSPQALAPQNTDHPAIQYVEFNTHIRSENYDLATELLLFQSTEESGLGNADAWASWRRWLTRRELREERADRAYQLASHHHLSSGSNFADLEFLAGFTSLLWLNEPEQAVEHFQALGSIAQSPISLGRALYWEGRALEVQGKNQQAFERYEEAARYWSSFYGQLALEKLGQGISETAFKESPMGWINADFTGSAVFEIGVLAYAAGETALAHRFLLQLVENLPPQEIALLGGMAEGFNDPYLAIRLSKRAAMNGHVIGQAHFPLHSMRNMFPEAMQPLVLAIARQESEFRSNLVSPAGALGFMQLMPNTARAVAARSGMRVSPVVVRRNWTLNAQLGAAYLSELSGRYDGNPILIAAAYNAGPGRVDQWLGQMGDPRANRPNTLDPLLWIELIPFRETRNYVMRVIEAQLAYRARLGMPIANISEWLAAGESLPAYVPFSAQRSFGRASRIER